MIPGFGILKLVLLTSIIAVAEAVVIELVLFAIARFRTLAIIASTGIWCLFFALLWVAAFSIAWHFAPFFPRRPL
jgi:hypothetical protein